MRRRGVIQLDMSRHRCDRTIWNEPYATKHHVKIGTLASCDGTVTECVSLGVILYQKTHTAVQQRFWMAYFDVAHLCCRGDYEVSCLSCVPVHL